MKVILTLFAIMICRLCIAQTPAPAPPTANPDTTIQMNPGYSPESPKTKADSLRMVLTNLKNAIQSANKLFIAKSDTMTITIPDVEYDNQNLAELKESIKNMKLVRSLAMTYSTSTANFRIIYKGKPTDVWDMVPIGIKSRFKLMEAGENNIILQYR